jgi:hypothetical protein
MFPLQQLAAPRIGAGVAQYIVQPTVPMGQVLDTTDERQVDGIDGPR